MWELDCEESWAPKNWCFWTVVLEKTLEGPMDCKEIQPVHSKGDQSWMFIGRTDAKAATLLLWAPHVKSWLIGKDPDAGRDWGQEEKGTTKDEMAGWHHWLDGHEFGWTPGVGDWQGGLSCCNSWGCKESDTTKWLNWNDNTLAKWHTRRCHVSSKANYKKPNESESHSVVSDSLRLHGLYTSWNSPGQNTGVGSCFLHQGIFSNQGSNPGLPRCRWILYQLSHQRSP